MMEWFKLSRAQTVDLSVPGLVCEMFGQSELSTRVKNKLKF